METDLEQLYGPWFEFIFIGQQYNPLLNESVKVDADRVRANLWIISTSVRNSLNYDF